MALTLAVAALVWIGLANLWIDRVGSRGVYDSPSVAPARLVAIVPGAGVSEAGAPSPMLRDRLVAALELYRSGKVKRILVSGDHASTGYDEPNAMRRWLVERGVPDEVVFMDHAGLRTLDTMDRAARIFLVDSAIVCTQRFHLHRSLFLARRAGIDAVGVVADRRVYLNANRNHLRETLAKTSAFTESFVLGTRARHMGDPLPITGTGQITHDAWTPKITE